MARNLGKIGEAFVDLTVKQDELQAQFTAAQRTAKRSSDRMARSIGSVDRRLAGAAKTAQAFGRTLGLIGGVAAVGALANLARRAIETGDAIAKTADKVGLGVEELQEYRFAAERAGVAQKQFDTAIQRFSRRVGQAAEGQGELLKTLQQYNIAIKDSEGNTRSNADILGDLADAAKGATSEQAQLLIAFKAFDSEGAALVNLLSQGSEGIDALRARARELGDVMSNETARAAERAADAITDFQAATGSLGQGLASSVLPPLTDFLELLVKVGQVFSDKLTKPLEEFSAATLRGELVGAERDIKNLTRAIEGFESGARGPGQEERIKLLNAELITAIAKAEELKALLNTRTAPPLEIDNIRPGAVDVEVKPTIDATEFERVQAQIDKTAKALADQAKIAGLTDSEQITLAETLSRLGVEFDVASGKVNILANEYKNLGVIAAEIARSDALKNPPTPEARPQLPDDSIRPGPSAEGARIAEALETNAFNADDKFKQLAASIESAKAASDEFGRAAGDALVDVALGAESLQDALKGVLETLARIVLQRAIAEPLANAVSAGTQSLFARPTPAAAGAVVPGNRISGGVPGIITRRNIVPLAGGGVLTGEAGSEAVVPLSPSRLGPLMAALSGRGGGGDQNVNIIDQRQPGAPAVEVNQRRPGVIDAIIRDQVQGNIERGAFDGSMGSRFGVAARPSRLRG